MLPLFPLYRRQRRTGGKFLPLAGKPPRMLFDETIGVRRGQTGGKKDRDVAVFVQPHGDRAAVLSDQRIFFHIVYCNTKKGRRARYFTRMRHYLLTIFAEYDKMKQHGALSKRS